LAEGHLEEKGGKIEEPILIKVKSSKIGLGLAKMENPPRIPLGQGTKRAGSCLNEGMKR